MTADTSYEEKKEEIKAETAMSDIVEEVKQVEDLSESNLKQHDI